MNCEHDTASSSMKKFSLLFIIGLYCFSINVFAQENTEPKKILFHVKTALNKDDAQICVFPNLAWASLEKGYDVTVLFDASAVTSIAKGWGWLNFGDSTPMDKAALPERERKSLSEQFHHDLEKIPRDYGEYLYFIKNLGAKVYINRTMMILYDIEPGRIDTSLSMIGLSKIIDLISEADIYMAY